MKYNLAAAVWKVRMVANVNIRCHSNQHTDKDEDRLFYFDFTCQICVINVFPLSSKKSVMVS